MSQGTPQERLQNAPVNLVLVGVVALLIIGGVAYAFFIAPAMREADIKKNWNSAEAAAQRGPNKQVSPAFEQAVMKAREKNALGTTAGAPPPVAAAAAPPPVGMPPPPPGMAPPGIGQPGMAAGVPGQGGSRSFSAHRRRDD